MEAAKPAEDVALLVDLGLAVDARDLKEQVFEHPVFVDWEAGSGRLHLFLDALDEAKIQIRRVVSGLTRELERRDLNRIVLRIACRTADRPVDLEGWLRKTFGDEQCRTLELAPLRVSETQAMAIANGVDPDRFVAEAARAGVAPLAARPLSLKMLLRVFLAENGFPDTLAALYQQALLLMTGEDDSERRALRIPSDTAAFSVAARIAAATMLSGRDVIGEGAHAVTPRELPSPVSS